MEREEKEHTTPQVPPSTKEGRENTPPAADGSAPFSKGDNNPPKPPPLLRGIETNFSAWQLAWELGYTIAIPIVALALLGRWGDRMLNTSPWLLLLGVLLSVVISSVIVYRKISRIL